MPTQAGGALGESETESFRTRDDGAPSWPRVSVVIPCYNRAAYLLSAVESVRSQVGGFDVVEILVIDDHSDEPTAHEALTLLAASRDVRVLENRGQRGPSAPRNLGLAHARGEWIAFLDSDDLWLPQSLEARARVIREHPQCRWIAADFQVLADEGTLTDRGRLWHGARSGPVLRDAYNGSFSLLERPVQAFVRDNLACTSTTLVKRDLLDEVGGFDERLRRANDRDLWVRLAAKADYWFVPDLVGVYRQHRGNLTKSHEPPRAWTIRSFRKLLRHPDYAVARRELRKQLAVYYARDGAYFRRQRSFAKAFGSYLTSLRFKPSNGVALRGLVASVLRHPSGQLNRPRSYRVAH